MNDLSKRNFDDQEMLEREHGRFVDGVNDRAITLQDHAYELGIARGKKDCAEALILLKKIATRERHRGSLTLQIEDLCEIEEALGKLDGSRA